MAGNTLTPSECLILHSMRGWFLFPHFVSAYFLTNHDFLCVIVPLNIFSELFKERQAPWPRKYANEIIVSAILADAKLPPETNRVCLSVDVVLPNNLMTINPQTL